MKKELVLHSYFARYDYPILFHIQPYSTLSSISVYTREAGGLESYVRYK